AHPIEHERGRAWAEVRVGHHAVVLQEIGHTSGQLRGPGAPGILRGFAPGPHVLGVAGADLAPRVEPLEHASVHVGLRLPELLDAWQTLEDRTGVADGSVQIRELLLRPRPEGLHGPHDGIRPVEGRLPPPADVPRWLHRIPAPLAPREPGGALTGR